MHVRAAPTARLPVTMHEIAGLAVFAATKLSIRTRCPNAQTQTYCEKPFHMTDHFRTRCSNVATNFARTDKMAPTDNQMTIDHSTAHARHSSLAGTRRVRCGLLACGGHGLLAASSLTLACGARLAAVLLFAGLTRELESERLVSLQRIGLSV